MRIVLFLIFLIGSFAANAQKYALLDKHLVEPIIYTNKVTSNDKFNGFFPVEKKELPQFIKSLK
jgi:hypothetical protein